MTSSATSLTVHWLTNETLGSIDANHKDIPSISTENQAVLFEMMTDLLTTSYHRCHDYITFIYSRVVLRIGEKHFLASTCFDPDTVNG